MHTNTPKINEKEPKIQTLQNKPRKCFSGYDPVHLCTTCHWILLHPLALQMSQLVTWLGKFWVRAAPYLSVKTLTEVGRASDLSGAIKMLDCNYVLHSQLPSMLQCGHCRAEQRKTFGFFYFGGFH